MPITTRTLQVELPDNKSYPIYIGVGLLNDPTNFVEYCQNREIMIVTNDTVGELYLESLLKVLMPIAKVVNVVSVIDSEKAKSPEYLNLIYTRMLEHNYSRKSLIIALGGGVIGDLAGYAAATYQRGIDFLQIPTTLLAQVDSSVGGKTGINHNLGKNMIGAFHQPKAVFIDLTVLHTLSPRQFAAGMAEVIKYGLIKDSKFFELLESNVKAIEQRDLEFLAHVVYRCCDIKRQVVQADEKEQGERALLNLGHTYGHAIEANFEYGFWLHGEAISTGMLLAGITSLNLAKERPDLGISFNEQDQERMLNIFKAVGLPTFLPYKEQNDAMSMQTWARALLPCEFLDYMKRDKKNLADQIVLVLLKSLGDAYIEKQATTDDIEQAIQQLSQYRGFGLPPLFDQDN